MADQTQIPDGIDLGGDGVPSDGPGVLMGGDEPAPGELGGDPPKGESSAAPGEGEATPEKEGDEKEATDEKPEDEKQKGSEKEPGSEDGPIAIDGVEYTRESLKEALSKAEDYTVKTQQVADQKKENEAAIEGGGYYAGIVQALDRSPESAARVIELILESAEKQHGREAIGQHLTVLDLENLSEEGRVLNVRLQRATKERDSLFHENTSLKSRLAEADKGLKELAPVVEQAKLATVLDAAVATISKDLNAVVTTAQLRKMCTDTSETDPVKAFKLSTYTEAQRKGYDKGYKAGNKSSPEMPDPNQKRVVDFSKMTADQIAQHMRAGALSQPGS